MSGSHFLASAIDDLLSIHAWIAQASNDLSTADRFIETLREKCDRLARLPVKMGRQRSELGRDFRSVPFQNYMIFFRYVDDEFEVINILHGSRDIEGFFQD